MWRSLNRVVSKATKKLNSFTGWHKFHWGYKIQQLVILFHFMDPSVFCIYLTDLFAQQASNVQIFQGVLRGPKLDESVGGARLNPFQSWESIKCSMFGLKLFPPARQRFLWGVRANGKMALHELIASTSWIHPVLEMQLIRSEKW